MGEHAGDERFEHTPAEAVPAVALVEELDPQFVDVRRQPVLPADRLYRARQSSLDFDGEVDPVLGPVPRFGDALVSERLEHAGEQGRAVPRFSQPAWLGRIRSPSGCLLGFCVTPAWGFTVTRRNGSTKRF